MKVVITKALLKRQASLLQAMSERPDAKTKGNTIMLTIDSCKDLIAETYGFKSYKELIRELDKEL